MGTAVFGTFWVVWVLVWGPVTGILVAWFGVKVLRRLRDLQNPQSGGGASRSPQDAHGIPPAGGTDVDSKNSTSPIAGSK